MRRHHRGRVGLLLRHSLFSLTEQGNALSDLPLIKKHVSHRRWWFSPVTVLTRSLHLGRPAGIAAAIALKKDLGYQGFTVCNTPVKPRPFLSSGVLTCHSGHVLSTFSPRSRLHYCDDSRLRWCRLISF